MRYDTIILGAGAAGMMCAGAACGKTLVIDHARAPGEKIRISGGGRCNFTNLYTEPENFLSGNPHFAKSALARYTQWDFIELVDRHRITWHEKSLGQLFCDESARQIISMLLDEMEKAGAELWLRTEIAEISHDGHAFHVRARKEGEVQSLACRNLVLATGGRSIPKRGATGFAYDVARQFGLRVTETRPALVPLTFSDGRFKELSGLSVPVRLSNARTAFEEALLFTHRGLSGPAVLQLSSYWREGESVRVDLDPGGRLYDTLRARRQEQGKRALKTELTRHLPQRLVAFLGETEGFEGNLADQSDAALLALSDRLRAWDLTPSGSEGYRTAEVTLGGVDTATLSSQSMAAKDVPGLYVIGEAVDVTGWLGGFNFQWAWASGHAAGTAIAAKLRA
ncbi:MAG: NAD(P)/FAD-dependent oxidoreductase [Arenibacterium sp.]